MVAIVEVRFLLMFRSMEARVGSYYFYWKRIHTAGQFFSMHSLFCLEQSILIGSLVRDKYGVLAEWSNAGGRNPPGSSYRGSSPLHATMTVWPHSHGTRSMMVVNASREFIEFQSRFDSYTAPLRGC